MADAQKDAVLDENSRQTITAVSSIDLETPVVISVNPVNNSIIVEIT